MTVVSLSNPYALITGVLLYSFFYRFAEKLEETRMGKNDIVWIVFALGNILMTYILAKGILVY